MVLKISACTSVISTLYICEDIRQTLGIKDNHNTNQYQCCGWSAFFIDVTENEWKQKY